MAGRLHQHTFWTAYRKLYVCNALARGDSRASIAERLGITSKVLSSAISRLQLKPESLLGPAVRERADG